MRNDFYGEGLLERKIVDRFIYRGKGRPRKQDYCTVKEAQRKINGVHYKLLSGLQPKRV